MYGLQTCDRNRILGIGLGGITITVTKQYYAVKLVLIVNNGMLLGSEVVHRN